MSRSTIPALRTHGRRPSRRIALAAVAAALLAPVAAFALPASVTLVGSLQSELGCAGDWDPSCAATGLSFDAADGVWQRTFALPAGDFEYKVAIDGSWAENYGAGGTQNGANIALSLAAATTVKFYFDYGSRWATDDVNSRIVTAPGSFQSELGCPGDWNPECLRSWLQDVDGDGVYTFTTTAVPPGSFETKAAIGERWDENYGAGGAPNGPNIPFTVSAVGEAVTFSFDSASNLLTVVVGAGPQGPRVPEPATLALLVTALALGIGGRRRRP